MFEWPRVYLDKISLKTMFIRARKRNVTNNLPLGSNRLPFSVEFFQSPRKITEFAYLQFFEYCVSNQRMFGLPFLLPVVMFSRFPTWTVSLLKHSLCPTYEYLSSIYILWKTNIMGCSIKWYRFKYVTFDPVTSSVVFGKFSGIEVQ